MFRALTFTALLALAGCDNPMEGDYGPIKWAPRSPRKEVGHDILRNTWMRPGRHV